MLQADDKPPHYQIAYLWKDTNPLVRFFHRLRPAYQTEPDTFLFRIRQKAGFASRVAPEAVIKAVFSVTKDAIYLENFRKLAAFCRENLGDVGGITID
ncbi:MAG: DUF2267 domain-containing protein [Oscillatoria princeps RMCB-10]|jgi:uncharacterized protein (DUF2267 family)|nr:DUF2267 domain-containing protein [Oscillatoria princeps RMCB-10]